MKNMKKLHGLIIGFLMVGSLFASQEDRKFDFKHAGRAAKEMAALTTASLTLGTINAVAMNTSAKMFSLPSSTRVIAAYSGYGSGAGIIAGAGIYGMINGHHKDNIDISISECAIGSVVGAATPVVVGRLLAKHTIGLPVPQMKSFNLEASRIPYKVSAAANASLVAGMICGAIGYRFLDEKFKVQD